MNPWFGIILVLIILASVMSTLRWVKRRYKPHPEVVRKLLHISMGLTTLTFPWLFEESWPVLLLAAITIPGLLLLRRSGRLKASLGDIINGVNRAESLGEIYFPLAVAGLFVLSAGDPLRYSISILLLTLADALAALVGVRYGQTQYATTEGYKSIEGSLAFFATAIVSVHVPLRVFSEISFADGLLIAVILGLLVTIVEALSWQGLDNLLVPIMGFMLLNSFLSVDQEQLVGRLTLAIGLVTLVMLWQQRTKLQNITIRWEDKL
jgi:phytol kinase